MAEALVMGFRVSYSGQERQPLTPKLQWEGTDSSEEVLRGGKQVP